MSSALLLILLQLIWLFGLLLGSLALGRFFLEKYRLTDLLPVSRIVIECALGLALLSYLLFTLTALHLVSYPFLIALSVLWPFWSIQLFKFSKWNLYSSESQTCRSPWVWVLIAYLAVHILLTLLPAFTPAWDWDGVAYHLALPKLYLAAGGFVFRPDIYHNLFPQFTEMLYMLGLVFPNGSAPKLLHAALGVLATVGVYALVRQQGLKANAWLAAAIFYSQYLVHVESSTAFIELASTLYTVMAILAVLQAYRTLNHRWAFLAAFFASVVAATKWHGLIVLALVGGFILLNLWIREPGSSRLKLIKTGWVLLWGSIPIVPYFMRAWILGHNPIWPLGYRWFGGLTWDAVIDKEMTAFVANFAGATKGLWGLIRLPYDLLVSGQQFGVGGKEFSLPFLGLMLLFIASWFLKPAPDTVPFRPQLKLWAKTYTALATLAFLLIWFFSSPQIRYLLPLMALAAYWATLVLARLWDQPKTKAIAMLCGALLFLVHPPVHKDTREQIRTGLGLETTAQFLSTRLNHYAACQFLNKTVAPAERVLLFKDNRGFYLDVDYLWGDPINQNLINYRQDNTPETLLTRFKTLHIKWVLFRTDIQYATNYYTPTVLALMQNVLDTQAEIKFQDKAVTVYRLKD